MKNNFRCFSILILAVALVMTFGFADGVLAEEYPESPIDMLVGFSAGGGTDVPARALSGPLEEELGVPVTVHNVVGAGGEVGFTELANSEPDGYTIGWINTPHLLNHFIQRDVDYHPHESFEPLVNVVEDPGVIAVPVDSEFESFSDIIEYSQENVVTYGTSGYGSDNHIAVRELAKEQGASFQHIPFDGGAEAITAGLGGHTTMVAAKVSEVRHHHPDGLRMLAIATDERHDDFPEMPTFDELGYELPVLWASARGIAAPSGLSEEKLDLLTDSILNAIESDRFKQAEEDAGLEINIMIREEYEEYLKQIEDMYGNAFEEDPW